MNLVNRKNELMVLAAVVMVMMGTMAYILFLRMPEKTETTNDYSEITTTSESTETTDIARDVDNTDFSTLDTELTQIEQELNSY